MLALPSTLLPSPLSSATSSSAPQPPQPPTTLPPPPLSSRKPGNSPDRPPSTYTGARTYRCALPHPRHLPPALSVTYATSNEVRRLPQLEHLLAGALGACHVMRVAGCSRAQHGRAVPRARHGGGGSSGGHMEDTEPWYAHTTHLFTNHTLPCRSLVFCVD